MDSGMILAAVLGVVFLIGFFYLFLQKSDEGDIADLADPAPFVGQYLLIVGLPLALAFVTGHFIIMYW
ncbi:MAG: hypothetical protein LAN62_03595 [Acidobacteriia bacterium]|nr:hypothetical protein [Terriglobia bacterium]